MPFKVTKDVPVLHDPMAVHGTSEFSDQIHAIIAQRRPTKIIETGTFLGTGTTAIIGSAIRNAWIANVEFFSIEINPAYFALATQNVFQQKINVRLMLGLSIPRSLLPTPEQIHKDYVQRAVDGVYVDWHESERVREYYRETDFANLPDDWLGKLLGHFNGKPDFLLLDSAGHMGYIEFQYVRDRLKGPCILGFDDTLHIKHFQSVKDMKSDPRFKILVESTEKFGFCIAEFNPQP